MNPIPIPRHMAHLRRHGGLPVPWVVCDGQKGRHRLVPSRYPGADLMVDWVTEGGPPDFGKYDDERQRASMHDRLCHVCRGGLPGLMLCVPRISQVIVIDGRECPLVSQPWVCGPCLAYAVVTCPPLRGVIERGEGLVLFARRHRLVSTYWRPVNPEDPVPPEGATVLSCFKVAVEDTACQTLPSWAAGVGRRILRKLEREATP